MASLKDLPCRVCGEEVKVDRKAISVICGSCSQKLVNYIRRKEEEALEKQKRKRRSAR